MTKYLKYCFVHENEYGNCLKLERIERLDKLPTGAYLERGKHDIWHCPYETNTVEGWQRWGKIRPVDSDQDFLTGKTQPGDYDYVFNPQKELEKRLLKGGKDPVFL